MTKKPELTLYYAIASNCQKVTQGKRNAKDQKMALSFWKDLPWRRGSTTVDDGQLSSFQPKVVRKERRKVRNIRPRSGRQKRQRLVVGWYAKLVRHKRKGGKQPAAGG